MTLNLFLVLDPRISYSALLDEFEGDDDLMPFLEMAKDKLHAYYKTYYADKTTHSSFPSPSNVPVSVTNHDSKTLEACDCGKVT